MTTINDSNMGDHALHNGTNKGSDHDSNEGGTNSMDVDDDALNNGSYKGSDDDDSHIHHKEDSLDFVVQSPFALLRRLTRIS